MQRIVSILLVLYAFAVPWQYALDLGEPFGNVARIVGLLLLAAAIPALLARPRWSRPHPLSLLVLALFLYLSATYLWSIDPLATLDKIRAYFQVMMVVWIAGEFVERPAQFRHLLRALLLGSIVLCALTFAGFLSASAAAAAEQARFTASGQDPNDVARFLDLVFPIAAYLIAIERSGWLRLLAALYFPLGLLAVLLTASRGGFLGAVVALLAAAVLFLRWRPVFAAWAGLLLALSASATALIVPPETFARLATIPAQFASLDFNDRFSIWTAGLHAFAHAPWLGFGAGNYALASGLAAEDTAHNTLVALLVMGGLLAASLLVAILLAALAAILRARGLARSAFLGVFLVWCVTASVGSVEENRMTWLIFACFLLVGKGLAETESPPALPPASQPRFQPTSPSPLPSAPPLSPQESAG